jgi:hypothetical protein
VLGLPECERRFARRDAQAARYLDLSHRASLPLRGIFVPYLSCIWIPRASGICVPRSSGI